MCTEWSSLQKVCQCLCNTQYSLCALLAQSSWSINVTFVQVSILYVAKGTMYLWILLSYLCTHVPIMETSNYLPRLKIVDSTAIRLDPRKSKATNGIYLF